MKLSLFCFVNLQLPVFKFPTNPGLCYQPGPEVWFLKTASKLGKRRRKRVALRKVNFCAEDGRETHHRAMAVQEWSFTSIQPVTFNYFSLCLVSYWCHKCWLGCCHSPKSSPGWLLRSWQILHNYSVWGPVRTSTKNKIWSLQKIWKLCYLPFPWSPLRLAKFFVNQKRQLK